MAMDLGDQTRQSWSERSFTPIASLEVFTRPPDVNLGQIWGELVTGKSRIGATCCDDENCYVSLLAPGGAERFPMFAAGKMEFLEGFLAGQSPKTLAFNAKRSPSSVTEYLRACRSDIGLGGGSRATPVAVFAMFQTRAGMIRQPKCAIVFPGTSEPAARVLRIERP